MGIYWEHTENTAWIASVNEINKDTCSEAIKIVEEQTVKGLVLLIWESGKWDNAEEEGNRQIIRALKEKFEAI